MNDTAPLISIIMPIFNGELYVEETIKSILNQSYTNFELLVINDGSTDNSREKISFYEGKDPRIKLINIENQGVSAARNIGLKLSQGKFICTIDADDLWSPEKLQIQLNKIIEDNSSVILGAVRRFSISEGKVFWGDDTTPFENSKKGIDYTRHVLSISHREMVLFNTLMIRRDALINAGGWDENLKNAEDWDFWCRLSSENKFIHLKDIVLFYRKHHMSATSQSTVRKALVSQLNVIDKACRAGKITKSEQRCFNGIRYKEAIGITNYIGHLFSSIKLLFEAAVRSSLPMNRVYYSLIADFLRGAVRKFKKK